MTLLNSYKLDFVLKRIPQTLLGGLKLHIGYCAPWYVYLNQLIIFLVPGLLGGILTLATEFSTVSLYITCAVYGVAVAVYTVLVQLIAGVLTRKTTVAPTDRPHNMLSDEDEVDFDGCCGRETVKFVSPVKPWYLIPVHAILAGLVAYSAMWYLLPRELMILYNGSVAGTTVTVMFGWLSTCIGLYSLYVSEPPELSQYKPLLTNSILPSRPVHIALLTAIHIVERSLTVQDYMWLVLRGVNVAGHVVYCTLILWWLSGVLPCTEALVLWLVEQGHVYFLGGSHMASPIRTLLMTAISCVCLSLFAVPDYLPLMVTLTGLQYCFSLDLCGLVTWLLAPLCSGLGSDKRPAELNLRLRTVFTVLYYVLMIGLVLGASAVSVMYQLTEIRPWLGVSLLILAGVIHLLTSLQRVYLLSLVRNPLYPNQVTCHKPSLPLRLMGLVRRFLLRLVCPLMMVMYVITRVTSDQAAGDVIHNFWYFLTAARVLRAIFQSTWCSLLDMSLHVLLTTWSDITWFSTLGTTPQLFIINLSRDKVQELLEKLWTMTILLIQVFKRKRGEKRQSCIRFFSSRVLPVLLVPVYISLVLVPGALLSAPLLPWFTLPWLWLSAPRPRYFWWEPWFAGTREQDCDGDALVYREAVPEICNLVRYAIAVGSLDDQPGSQYVVRYEDRLVWVSVLERGFSFSSLIIKGLELQEPTSCHSAEANHVDDTFTQALDTNSRCGLNKQFMHTLTAKCSGTVYTYSETKTALTGVIDEPGTLKRVFTRLPNTLVWHFVQYLVRHARQKPPKSVSKENKENKMKLDKLPSIKVAPVGSKSTSVAVQGQRMTSPNGQRPNQLPPLNGQPMTSQNSQPMTSLDTDVKGGLTLVASKKTSSTEFEMLPPIKGTKHAGKTKPAVLDPWTSQAETGNGSAKQKLKSKHVSDCDLEDLLDDWDKSSPSPSPPPCTPTPPTNSGKVTPRHVENTWSSSPKHVENTWSSPKHVENTWTATRARNGRAASPAPSELSIWSDDSDHVVQPRDPPKNHVTQSRDPPNGHVNLLEATSDRMDDIDVSDSFTFAPPRTSLFPDDVNSSGKNDVIKSNDVTIISRILQHDIKTESLVLQSPDKWLDQLSVPRDTIDVIIRRLTSSSTHREWTKRVISQFARDMTWSGETLYSVVTALTAIGQYMFYGDCSTDQVGILGRAHIHSCYSGRRIDTQNLSWVDKDLRKTLIQAYTYCVKICIDEAVLFMGDSNEEMTSEDMEELVESLTEFDRDWYIGSDTESDWAEHVTNGTRMQLMSVSYNDHVYTSRRLSHTPVSAHVGQLHGDLVRAQWANLSLELLYMTNDDDERHSIQTQPNMLRNLTVQSAHAPLGYPVYTSPPQSVHTF